MPLSAAEKQRRYRERRDNDPLRRAEYLEKEKRKYRADLTSGKKKLVAQLTDREKRHQRKEWKKRKQTQRQRKKREQEAFSMNTPPQSPIFIQQPQQATHRGEHNSRKKKRQIAKCYRDNALLLSELETQKRLNARLRKRLERERKKTKINQPETPKTKTKQLLRNFTSNMQQKKKVKRTLLFHFVLKEELKEKYKRGNNHTKNNLLQILKGKIMKKYKCMHRGMNDLCFNSKKTKRVKKGNLTSRLKTKIQNFYERDDNSRTTAGIKETITRRKMKKQKRILLNTIEKLFEKFRLENTDTRLSYTTFSRLRPFWVVIPKENDRETCACKQHENLQLLAEALQKNEIIKTKDLHTLVDMFSCDIKNISCMYGKCPECREIIISTSKFDKNKEIKWAQWQTLKEKRIVKKIEKEVNVTVKREETGDIGTLIDRFSEGMTRFKVHFYNIENQLKHFRYLKENMKENEALIHVDFSENYECKLTREIQSMHFGASKKQITLHTGVCYTKSSSETFCAVSNSLEHGPQAVWAYLRPFLDKVMQENKGIDTLHFYSDGATSQYKQKGNFYLFTKEMSDRGICLATWNFHESGHGKGVPDGVGGSLKRTGNALVLHGHDITDAASFISSIKEQDTSVYLYEVSEDRIPSNSYEQKLKPVPGTYKVHQIKTQNIGEVWHRDVSCFCEEGEIHVGHEWKYARVAEKIEDGNSTQSSKPQKRKVESYLSKVNEENKDKRETASEGTYLNVAPESRSIANRDFFFEQGIQVLGRCSSYEELAARSEELHQVCETFTLDYEYEASIMNTGLPVDEFALDIYPTDTPQHSVLYPVNVKADGNCLPYAGSIHGFGNQSCGTEMRVRIIIEGVLNKSLYLSQEFLEQGVQKKQKKLARTFALYSDEYFGSNTLNEEEVENIYKREMMKITKNAAYMGIWQLFSLASVLGREIFSIYPCKGNVNVRRDLHRLIEPRVKKSMNRCYIMWSSTRSDMTNENWVPNHFVAVLPIETEYLGNITMQRGKLIDMRKLEKEAKYQKTLPELPKKTSAIFEDKAEKQEAKEEDKAEIHEVPKEEDKAEKQEVPKEEDKAEKQEVQKEEEMEEKQNVPKVEEREEEQVQKEEEREVKQNVLKEGESKKLNTSLDSANTPSIEVPPPAELLGRYVLVKYEEKPYPGIVVDVDECEVYVQCMHCVCKSHENIWFYWPKTVKDICWYEMENVLAVIPEPEVKNRKYFVQTDLWNYAVQKCTTA